MTHYVQPADYPAYILAGGSSSRFGSDKALVEIGGEIQLLRLRKRLVDLGHAVEVVADSANRYRHLGLDCLVDRRAQCGPLAGLATVLEHRLSCYGSGWALLLGCDQIRWDPAWLSELSTASDQTLAVAFSETLPERHSSSDSAPVLKPGRTERKDLQPIPGIYHSGLLKEAQRRLAAGDLSLRGLFELPDCNFVFKPEGNPRCWSFNTPDELQRALASLKTKGGQAWPDKNALFCEPRVLPPERW